jgi:hypothetical protein
MKAKLTFTEIDTEYGASIQTIIDTDDFGMLAQECLKRMDVGRAYSLLGVLRERYGKMKVAP